MKAFRFFILLLALPALSCLSIRVLGQSPAYYCELKNDERVSPTVYEMDLYLFRTGSVPLELAAFQTALLINPVFVNSGTITSEIIAGSSELNLSQMPAAIQLTSNCIKIAPVMPARTYDNIGHTTTTSGTVIPITGLRICRLRLTNSVDFGSATMNPTWNFTASPYNTIVSAYTGADPLHKTNTIITSDQSHSKNLNLTLFLEGLYNSATGLMNKTRDSDGESDWDKFAGSTVDTISVLLAETADPWNIIAEVHGIPLNIDGTCRVPVHASVTENRYIIIKHRNSVETWSKDAGESFTGANINYNFTSALSQSFGNNLKLMGTSYALWGGEVTQDGYVDGFDLAAVFNQNQIGAFGYSPEDVTGDGYVDGFDLALVFNNNQIGVGMDTPAAPLDKLRLRNRKH